MKRSPPKKKEGKATGRRRIDGMIKDVAGMAATFGVTEKQIRAEIARGLLPYRRLGGRIVFLADEIETFLRQLPGVSAEQALSNIGARSIHVVAPVPQSASSS